MTLLLADIAPSDAAGFATAGTVRIASVLVPVISCDVVVTVAKVVEIDEFTELLLDTIDLLNLDGLARLDDLASMTGLEPPFATRLINDLVDQSLAHADQGELRVADGLQRDGRRVLVQQASTETVVAIGTPPWPLRGLDSTDLANLKPHRNANVVQLEVHQDLLERWLKEWWGAEATQIGFSPDSRTQASYFVSRWTIAPSEATMTLLDDRGRQVAIDVPLRHPHVHELQKHLQRLTAELQALFAHFGRYDHGRSTLVCSADEWDRWISRGGSLLAEVTAQDALSGIALALQVSCTPADPAAARRMMGDTLLRDLERTLSAHEDPLVADQLLDGLMAQLGRTKAFEGVEIVRPSLQALSALAWDRGQWELCYRLARGEDAL